MWVVRNDGCRMVFLGGTVRLWELMMIVGCEDYGRLMLVDNKVGLMVDLKGGKGSKGGGGRMDWGWFRGLDQGCLRGVGAVRYPWIVGVDLGGVFWVVVWDIIGGELLWGIVGGVVDQSGDGVRVRWCWWRWG